MIHKQHPKTFVITENQSFRHNIFKGWKIDSLKISLDVKFLDKIDIPEKYYLISENGELIEEFKRKSFKVYYNGNEFYISVIKHIMPKQNDIIHRFYLLAKSGLQNGNYFKGVDLKLIKALFSELKKQKLISYKNFFDIFPKMVVSDIDICIDYIMGNEHKEPLKEHFETVKSFYKISNKISKGCETFTKKGQIGLQVNRRENSTLAKPFFKLYNKSLEILRHSNIIDNLPQKELYYIEHFLIIRYELTIKNNEFFKEYNLKNSLPYWLKSKDWKNKIDNIKKIYFARNFTRTPKNRTPHEITPTNKIILDLVTFIKEHFENIEQYKPIFEQAKKHLKTPGTTELQIAENQIFKDKTFIDIDILNIFLKDCTSRTQKNRNNNLFSIIFDNYNILKQENKNNITKETTDFNYLLN